MSVGLDLGTTEFRSIRDSGGDLVARRCKASYLALKDTSGHRRLLDSIQARYGTCGDDMVVFGDDALECGSMLNLPVIPLLPQGRLPSADPVARQIVALMVEAVLPAAATAGDVCCLTVPGGYGLDGDSQSLDVRFFKQLVTLRGYSVQLISSGHAVVLAELSNAMFSGLGISLGATNCEIGVIHNGRELSRCTVASSLSDLKDDSEDGSLAELSASRAGRSELEQCRLRTLTSILTEAREALDSNGALRLMQQPISIACTGGIAEGEEFGQLFAQAWSQSGWPVKVAQTRFATNPRFAVARGGLIKAILEQGLAQDRRVA
jgi:hypothetical protein